MNSPLQNYLTRRQALLRLAAAGLGTAILPGCARLGRGPAADPPVLQYLETLRREDGGYGWGDQPRSHLTPTFAAIGCYRVLRQSPPQSSRLARFVRSHHPSALKKLEQEHRDFDYQQLQALAWLGEDLSTFQERVEAWRKPTIYLKQYESSGYPVFRSEMATFSCRALLGLPADAIGREYIEYLNTRRRPNGSFNNTPAEDYGDGHVLNTLWGLRALQLLNRQQELQAETVAWLRACQRETGGFTYQPEPGYGGVEDVDYTWAALETLTILGSAPAKSKLTIGWLRNLANADGGFGNRPGWQSNPVATYHAVRSFELLGELWDTRTGTGPHRVGSRTSLRNRSSLPPELKVFSAQIEAHGQGCPSDAVELARSLRIHLWGAKNPRPGWIEAAQRIALRERVPVTFFTSNEEYGTWVRVPGLGTYSHTSDIVAPAGTDFGSSLANAGVVTWPEFRQRRLAPLQKAGGRLIWQFGENEELVRLLLDDSLQRGGYAAISTFHFGNPDFTNSEPFLKQYRGQMPFVALQDAHGPEPWWFADMTTGFRTLFLARECTWDSWLEALANHWVAAVRHDAVSGHETWIHGSHDAVLERMMTLQHSWRWWDNLEIARPMLSIVVVRPEDEFETARPDSGITVRVRCAWENTTQGFPKVPLVELSRMTLNGKVVVPEYVTRRRAGANQWADCYHQFHLLNPPAGNHTVAVEGRSLANQQKVSRTIVFRT